MRSNPGKSVTIYEIPALVKKAQLAAMTPKNILSGFECTGTWPFIRKIFTELDFAPAAVTDRLLSTDTEIQSNRRRRRLKRYPLQVRHKQDWGRGFILLLPQTAVLPESDAGSDVIEPASSFVIKNRQTSCSMWCPMYRARC